MYVHVLRPFICLFRIVCTDLRALKFGYECDYARGSNEILEAEYI